MVKSHEVVSCQLPLRERSDVDSCVQLSIEEFNFGGCKMPLIGGARHDAVFRLVAQLFGGLFSGGGADRPDVIV